MTQYHISTDDGSMDIEADSVESALREFDAPEHVQSVHDFESWLNQSGGYGFIEEDGDRIASVAKDES